MERDLQSLKKALVNLQKTQEILNLRFGGLYEDFLTDEISFIQKEIEGKERLLAGANS